MEDQIAENKALVRRYWEEVWNEGKLDLIPEFMDAPDHRLRVHRDFIAGWRNAFPGTRAVIDALIAEDDLMVVRYSFQGAVHTGVWEESLLGLSMAVPPTGKEIQDSGILIYRFSNGKFWTIWGEWSRLEVAQQLGVVPTSG